VEEEIDMAEQSIIATDKAPSALGPYSQGVVLSLGDKKLVFASGQIAIDPATGELIGGGPEDQVRRVLENVRAILQTAGTDLDRVVKTTMFLTNLDDFGACNSAYAEYFTDSPPARATVEVTKLPLGAVVEIDVIAYAG
jgi:2-iminobutanoate/2-iminopropanoate deaminase